MPVQTYTTLDDPSATAGTFVQGINSSGQIVGYYHDNQGSGLHGFLCAAHRLRAELPGGLHDREYSQSPRAKLL